MKICPNCQNAVDDAALFCDRCGVRFAVAPQPTPPQPTYNYGAQPVQPQQPVQPVPQPQPPRKKSKAGLVIGIIAAALVTLVAIVLVVVSLIPEDDDYDYYGEDTYYDDIFEDTVDYTPGTIEDGDYVNEWANIRMDLDGLQQGSTAEYNDIMDDPDTECGLVVSDGTSTKQFIILFEDVSAMGADYDESDYLDDVTDGLESDYAEEDMTVSVSDYYSPKFIGGEIYKTASVTFEDVTLMQLFHVRREGDYMITLMVTAVDNTAASSLTNRVLAY